MLSIDSLHVTYGGAVQAVRGVSMEVPDGKVVAVLGSNGAGKSTLLRTISGTLQACTGARSTPGRSGSATPTWSAATRARSSATAWCRCPRGAASSAGSPSRRTSAPAAWATRTRRAKAKAQDRVYDLFPVLKERSTQRGGLLSGGEQQMLAIGRALMGSPKLLLLDEPSLGLAPRIIGQIGEVIAEINRQGTSVLLVEQNATMALGVADLAYVLDVGEVSLSGDARELAQTDEVQRLYLGHDGDRRHPKVRAASGKKLSRWTA